MAFRTTLLLLYVAYSLVRCAAEYSKECERRRWKMFSTKHAQLCCCRTLRRWMYQPTLPTTIVTFHHYLVLMLAPTTLFHVRGRNLATELSLWPGQSCGTVCQRQVVTRTVNTLLNADSNRTFLACVLMIDSVMPFRSGFAHGGH